VSGEGSGKRDVGRRKTEDGSFPRTCFEGDKTFKWNKNMSTRFKFENLLIWNKAMDFGEGINLLVDSFPKKEKYNLSSQARRAADSVALNIAEGSIGHTNKEFRRFLGFSIRSLAEVVTCLYKARRRNYINSNEFSQKYTDAYNLMNMMIGLRNKLL